MNINIGNITLQYILVTFAFTRWHNCFNLSTSLKTLNSPAELGCVC